MKTRYLYKFLDVTIILTIVILSAGLYLLDYTLTPDHRGKKEEESLTFVRETYPQIVPWLDSLSLHRALCDTFIVNPEGLRLHAYFAKAPHSTSRTAVIIHGYTDNALRMLMIGHMYHHVLGFNILLPSLQYHGRSEGNAIQMGWDDRLDVLQWIDVSRSLFGGEADSSQIVVHGISMGAATVMALSGEELPSHVKCLIEDCGYTSVWDEFAGELKNQFGLPKFPILYVADFFSHVKHGWGFKEASPLKQVTRCELPMLFIHGAEDSFVPTEMVYRLYEAKPEPKELWVVPGAGHARSFLDYPQEYTERVASFIHPYIHP